MISHHEAQLALRTKLLALSVATTGSTALSATSTGYARAAGSFVTDGFRPGMELAGTGWSQAANNAAKTVTAVTATALTCTGCVVEAEGSRTLSVGLPASRSWENLAFEPVVGTPWVDEQYLPGPMRRETLGPLGLLEVLPTYVVRVHVPAGQGMSAARLYADKLLALFAPSTLITLSGGDVMLVRGDVAPYAGQLLQATPGYAVQPITVPLRMRTTNSI